MEIENSSNKNLVLTNCRDTSSLRLQLNQKSENNMGINWINYIKKRKTTKAVFDDYDLDFYAFYVNNEKYYKLFFLIYEKVNDKIIFKSNMDSISVEAKEIELGENNINYFSFKKDKLIFKKGIKHPVRAGIVAKAPHYIYSNARNYIFNTGLLKIEKADIPIVDVLNLNNFTKYNEY